MTSTLSPQSSLPALAALVDLQVQGLIDRLQAKLSALSAPTAASLYRRAARYEAHQPGFAADLRAAAEAMDREAAVG